MLRAGLGGRAAGGGAGPPGRASGVLTFNSVVEKGLEAAPSAKREWPAKEQLKEEEEDQEQFDDLSVPRPKSAAFRPPVQEFAVAPPRPKSAAPRPCGTAGSRPVSTEEDWEGATGQGPVAMEEEEDWEETSAPMPKVWGGGPSVAERLAVAPPRPKGAPPQRPALQPYTPSGALRPTPPAKAKAKAKAPKASAPSVPTAKASKAKEAPGLPAEPVLETEDWAREFEKKWAAAMGDGDAAEGGEAPLEPERPERPEPPAKRLRTAPTAAGAAAAAGGAAAAAAEWAARRRAGGPAKAAAKGPTPPSQPPPSELLRDRAPPTPGTAASGAAQPAAVQASEVQIRAERPEWAPRCTLEPARPGQPQRLAVSMAEMGLGDAEVLDWCDWMDRRLSAERPLTAAAVGGRARFRAGTVDLSENQLGAAGAKALCGLLERHGVACEVLRLTGNAIGNDGLRHIAKYLTSASQALALELHLSRNRLTPAGVKWLLGCLALHPAYPVWNAEAERFVPLWLRFEGNRVAKDAQHTLLRDACAALFCSVCTGERSGALKCGPLQCVNVGCSDETKHNCVAHMCGWEAPEGSEVVMPGPVAHPRPIFGPPGRAAPKPPPSGVDRPLREEPRIVYEDDDIAVVMKPPGWSCLPQPQGVSPGWSQLKPLARRKQVAELMTQTAAAPLQAWLLLHFGADPTCDASRDQESDRGLAHRLDVDTSGPILVGKTLKGYEHARKQIVLGILKDYLALVHGSFSTDRGECRAPIDTSPYADTKQVRADAAGQPATTVWEAIAEYESPDRQEKYTLVLCRMVTLRTHQIRVHMQHLGHPLVGDRLYGAGDPPAFCPRIFLHKLRIGFFSPKGQACVEVCSLQAAPDLWKALGGLRKVGGMARTGCGAPGL